jgi:phospholipid N-methyltransferase
MEQQLRFFKEYCRDAKGIGAFMPDSKTCVDSLLRQVPFATAEVIMEFGAASGAVTREIIKRKQPETLFISFEKNANLYEPLKESVWGENFFLLNEDVFDCVKVLNDIFGIKGKSVDCIVSTLPCSCLDFDRLIRQSVLPILKEKGDFVQYMHTLSLLKGFSLEKSLMNYFPHMHPDLVLLNVPPALVYACHAAH